MTGSASATARGDAHSAPVPSGPSSHFWPGKAMKSAPMASASTRIAPADWAASTAYQTPRSRAMRPISTTGSTAPVVHSTWERETRRVRGVMAAAIRSWMRAGSPPPSTSTMSRATPARSRTATRGPSRPGCSAFVVRARSPGRQSTPHVAMFMPSVVEWVSAIDSGPAERSAASTPRHSSMRSRKASQPAGSARPTRSSQSSSSRMALTVAAGSGPDVPVLR